MRDDSSEDPRDFPPPSRLRNVVGHRFFPLIVALVAMVLVLPSLNAGLLVDDYHHKLLFTNSDSPARLLESPLDMFSFFNGDPGHLRQLKDLGLVPWWTGDGVKAAFWRPLTSLTHWLDYQLWPDTPALMHAQSIFWYGLLVLVTALLYRRLASTAAMAGFAAFLFACDDAHGTPVGFLANRNALIAATFGVLALIAHHRHRRIRARPALFGAMVALIASLLSAEAGIATMAYLASYALFIDRESWKSRVTSMLPYLAIIVVWRLLWNGLGYGIENIGLYVDPLGEPGRYLTAVKDRAPILLLAQFFAPPADVTILLTPASIRLLWLAAMAFLGLFALLLIPLLRRDRIARFWALATLLSILPVCATFPSDRLLVFTGIGAMGLTAQFLSRAFTAARQRLGAKPWRFGAVVLASLFLLVQAVIAPVALVPHAASMAPKQFMQQMMLDPLDEAVETQDLIVVNPPIAFLAIVSPLIWADQHAPFPRHLRLLCSGLFKPVQVTRPDACTLVVRPYYGYYGWVLDALFRHPEDTFQAGDRIELAGMTVQILQTTAAGRPLEAAFIFPVPLEDPSLRWMQYGSNGFEPFTPPPVDGSAILPAPPPPWRR